MTAAMTAITATRKRREPGMPPFNETRSELPEEIASARRAYER